CARGTVVATGDYW
nr:immunoglobulin heavy chain junction region [Mus musculus]MBK4195263.1 immunoglobulin heavy chain junction region [Mus musculus]